MAEEVLTAEDRAWLESPVDVQVPPDNQKWLDTMLEMKRDDLIRYAVYQYGLEEDAMKASSRNGILQLILLANQQGGGGSVLRTRYRYINGLKGILPPELQVREKSQRAMYLTRGEGKTMQVLNKTTGEWISVQSLLPKNVTTAEAVAESVQPVSSEPAEPSLSIKMLVPMIAKMSREQLMLVANELKIEDPGDMDKYPTNGDLRQAIYAKAGVEPPTNPEQAHGQDVPPSSEPAQG